MKILPDYLIEMMPALEEALEELRLSVIDHAYELLKCLDVDELSSDTIRRKLELYDLKIDNMTEEWLPNGKFYRMYPAIKYNRTRLNSLKSVVCSGGQFEGLWSNEFIKESEHNYNKIRTLRHYTVQSEYDGYFYVSGNVSRILINGQDLVYDSTLTALSTDILLSQAMPAGYTYLYVPWPRPTYPGDAGYFYNVNMLNADRLQYAIDCDSTITYDESVPASTRYDWQNGTNTPWRAPYWIDYHFMNDMRHDDPSNDNCGKWPICEHGRYVNYNEDGIAYDVKPEQAGFYILDDSCKTLSYSNSVFPTKCYIRSSNRTTKPNYSQVFVPNTFHDDKDLNKFITEIFTIDSNNIDDIEKINKSDYNNELYGTYRWDHLFSRGLHIIQDMSHIKTYKPIWSESSPVFAMMQSNYNSGLHPEGIAQHSFYNWFELKRQENIILPGNNTIKDNEPSISEITHTPYDRPTGARIITNDIIVYTRAANDSQGNNKVISLNVNDNTIYALNESISSLYNPELQYELLSLNSDENGTQIQYKENIMMYLEGDPSTNKLYLNKYTDSDHSKTNEYNYITCKSNKIHRLWFSDNKEDTYIDKNDYILYNSVGSRQLYYSDQIKKIEYNVIGIYDRHNNEVKVNGLSELSLTPINSKEYGISSNTHNIITTLYIEYNQENWIITDANEDANLSSLGNDYFYFKSNQISDNESTIMTARVVATKDCVLKYKIKNDSEYNYDYIYVVLDGNIVASAQSLNNAWLDVNINISIGEHTISFIYKKDISGSQNADAGFIAIKKDFIDENTLTYTELSDEIIPFTASYILFTAKLLNEYEPIPPKVYEQYGIMTNDSDIEKHQTESGSIINPILRYTAELNKMYNPKIGIMRDPVSTTLILGEESNVDGEPLYVEGPYYYMYNFNAGSNTNLYYNNPDNPKYSEQTVLYKTESDEQFPPTSNYSDIILKDDSGVTYSCADNGITVRISNFVQDGIPLNPEIHMSGWPGAVNDPLKCAALVLIDESNQTIFTKSIYRLPNDLYSISDANVNWNTDHILYDMLYGKPVIVWYIPNNKV